MVLRLGLWLVVIFAVLAVAWLVYEWYSFAQTMPDRGWNFHVYRIVGLVVVNLIFTAVLAIIAALYLWVRLASSLPDLQGWHIEKPESEFRAADAVNGYTLDDYLAQEDRVFKELDALIAGPWANQSPGAYSRYHADSVCNPETIVDRNWNRSLILESPDPIGGVLLLHGLSDAPYSLRIGPATSRPGVHGPLVADSGTRHQPRRFGQRVAGRLGGSGKGRHVRFARPAAQGRSVGFGRLLKRRRIKRSIYTCINRGCVITQGQGACFVFAHDWHQSHGQNNSSVSHRCDGVAESKSPMVQHRRGN